MRQSRSPTSRHSSSRGQEQRQRIAIEAARLMVEHGIQDFALAKRKAAERLGNYDTVTLPKNSEIETALREHQRLFRATTQAQLLLQRRTVAREAMRFLTDFEPRLVGNVLEGTADAHSAVCLHVFSDDPQALPLFLAEHHIPYDEQTRRLRLDQHRSEDFPVYVFSADGIAIDLTVLPLDLLRQAPLSPIDERPMQRASLNMLLKLLDEPLSQDGLATDGVS